MNQNIQLHKSFVKHMRIHVKNYTLYFKEVIVLFSNQHVSQLSFLARQDDKEAQYWRGPSKMHVRVVHSKPIMGINLPDKETGIFEEK